MKHKPLHDTRWPGASACLLVEGACGKQNPSQRHQKWLNLISKLISKGFIHIQCKKPFLVSSDDITRDISTNKSLMRPLSFSDLTSSSASTLLRRDSTLPEWRSKLAGRLLKIGPYTLDGHWTIFCGWDSTYLGGVW